jgi:uncharacterized protein (DUF427 family)
MKKAIWNGQLIAESDKTVVIEGNHYFPSDSINKDFFKESERTSICPWKGVANYFNIEVDGQTNMGAAWYYKQPSDKAKEIKDHVAFWKGIPIPTSQSCTLQD